MNSAGMNLLLWISPLLIGGIVALLNKDGINEFTEKIEAWIRERQQRTSISSNWFSSYILNSILWVVVKFSDWTDDFTHRGAKNGVRVAATLYFIATWLYILFALLAIAFFIAIAGVIIYIIFKVLLNNNEDFRKGFNAAHGVFGKKERDDVTNYAGLKGNKIYEGTNWFNEELKGRVDEQGNIYRGTNWFNEDKIGRIDEDGNIFSGTNFFNEEKVGRIDEDGNVHKGTNWFNEEKTGRIDEDGNIHKGTNWFNEEKTGRTGS